MIYLLYAVLLVLHIGVVPYLHLWHGTSAVFAALLLVCAGLGLWREWLGGLICIAFLSIFRLVSPGEVVFMLLFSPVLWYVFEQVIDRDSRWFQAVTFLAAITLYTVFVMYPIFLWQAWLGSVLLTWPLMIVLALLLEPKRHRRLA